MPKIAIIGAGFCGVATAWFLSRLPNHDIVLFDPHGIGGGASGVAAGLLHAYAGPMGRISREAQEGMAATLELLEKVPQATQKSGLLRLALNEQQVIDFQQSAQVNSEVEWLTADRCQALVPGIVAAPGIWIKEAWIVHTKAYLEGLWHACADQGAKFVKQRMELSELKDFDQILVTAGFESKHLVAIPLTPVKGQLVEIRWPKNIPIPPIPVSSQAYLVPDQNTGIVIAGATFEKTFANNEVDMQCIESELLPKIQALYPQINVSHIKQAKAAVRASAPRHMPYIGQVDERTWVLTGMGSKGLLYHALYAKKLVEMIEASQAS